MKQFLLLLLILAAAPLMAAPEGVDLSPYRDRFHRSQPLVAVVAENRYTEITDFLVPYGILSASGGLDVHALSLEAGPVGGFPALTFEVPETVEQFDTAHPEGADYLIVPAVHDSENPRLLSWVKAQAKKGGVVVGVCDGVWVLAKAGLLEGRSAVGHWNSLPDLRKQFPSTTWVRDRRYWQDGSVLTTTGVSASVPISLALVEALCGPAVAARTASDLGLTDAGPDHRTGDFQWSAAEYATLAGNWAAFWNHERVGIPLVEGMDEVALAVNADAWGRSFRAEVVTVSATSPFVKTKGGIRILADQTGPSAGITRTSLPSSKPGLALDSALAEIRSAYGKDTEILVRRLVELDEVR